MNVPPNGTMETNGQQEVLVDADTHEDAIINAIEQNELEGDIGDTLAIWVTPTPEDPNTVTMYLRMSDDETEWSAQLKDGKSRKLTEEELATLREKEPGMYGPMHERKA